MARPPITRARPYTPQSGTVAGQTFTSERQYRNALARAKGFRSWSAQQQDQRTRRPGTRMREEERAAQRRAFDAVSKMRAHGLTLTEAARAAGTTVNTVKRHMDSALQRQSSGRYSATSYDRQTRSLHVLTAHGMTELPVRDSRSAARVATYWNAVHHYLDTGDARPLQRFRGQGITVQKRFYPFITDLDVLDQLADAGELVFDDLYDVRAA